MDKFTRTEYEFCFKKIFLKIFETYYDMPLWLCCIFQKPYVYTGQTKQDRLQMYNTDDKSSFNTGTIYG